MFQTQSGLLDRCGIWLSSVCALHCVLLPVLLPILPLLASSILAEHWFERMVLIASAGIGAIAMSVGMIRHHGNFKPLVLLAIGVAVYWFKDAFDHHWEPAMVCVGAALIIGGHVMNMRLIKRCSRAAATNEESAMTRSY